MKRGILVFLLIFSLPFISAAVFINEVELNPQGMDAGNEWVELYNDGNPINLSGWYLTDKDSTILLIPNLTIVDFLVVDNLNTLVNNNENISLYNTSNDLQDITGPLTDGSDDNRTWQRVPDGTGNFTFKNRTKGALNAEALIENKTIDSQCIFATDNVTLTVEVTGACIQEVIFSVLINNTLINFTGTNLNNLTYRTFINHSFFTGSEFVNWTVFALSCSNQTVQDGMEQFYVNVRTSLSINPTNPDGINGWYVTEPQFTLSNPDALQLFYRWDSTGTLNYSGSFGLEDTPNNGNVTGGIIELTYWGNACTMEPEQNIILKTDFMNPFITDLQPPANGLVMNNLRPTIQALLDEIYQSNSGINHSSVVMLLDGVPVAINVFTSDTLDAIVRHNPPGDLSLGLHNVTVNVSDNAGRKALMQWMFEINISQIFNFTLFFPQNISYNTRRISFNISATEILQKMEFINNNERNPRWKVLCKQCSEYGFTRKKTVTLLEGVNMLRFRLTDQFGNVQEQNITLFIDSMLPKISQTLPRKNIVTNGSLFQVKYSEDRLQSVMLSWNPVLPLLNCPSGKNQICSTSINLSDFDQQFIDYFFNLSDGINIVQSKPIRVKVDTTSPIINISEPLNATYTMKAPFNITISEKVLLEYMDLSDFSPRFKRLCSNCNEFGTLKPKFVRFSIRQHGILLRATDDAGNTDIENVNVTIT